MKDPAVTFEPHRRRLLGLAYRMLGSVSEAEDAVQDAYLRWHAIDRDTVSDVRAFLTTTTTRICLDTLKSARARRETYVGPWLPEPVLNTGALAPDTQSELAEDLSIALLLALDRLSPLERAPFCCTTCSTFRTANWPPHWSGARLRAVNWRPAHGSTCALSGHVASPRRIRARSMPSMLSSCRHSWRRLARAISMR